MKLVFNVIFIFLLSLSFGQAGADDTNRCLKKQPFPYPEDSPYVGLHGNRENNNRIFCEVPTTVKISWKALKDHLIFQPISISADGKTIYATAVRMEGCKLFAVNSETGEISWCKEEFSFAVAGGTPEVDKDGFLYITDSYQGNPVIYSLNKDGKIRWRTILEDIGGKKFAKYNAPAGLHFTPAGFVATVTPGGVVVLLSREEGKILATFDIPENMGFVPAEKKEINIPTIPKYLHDKLSKVLGNIKDEMLLTMLGASAGASGEFSDNTVGISSQNQIFVVGGGPDSKTGSLIALDIVEINSLPSFKLRWYMPISAGSATSPAVSPDGKFAVIGDGVNNIVYIGIEQCNNNTDSDSHENVCSPLWLFPLKGEHLQGSPALDENGIVYVWDSSKNSSDADLLAIKNENGQPEILWEVNFTSPGGTNRQWTSAATVTDNLVIGTLSDFKTTSDLGLKIPMIFEASHEIVAVDRKNGKVVWRAPIEDDSINSIAIGQDGSIYVPLMGMIDMLSPNPKTEYHGGIIKYAAPLSYSH